MRRAILITLVSFACKEDPAPSKTSPTPTPTATTATLCVNEIGNGSVQATGVALAFTDAGFDCYSGDAAATLTAVPGQGATFTRWDGSAPGCSGSEPVIQIPALDDDSDCTATFEDEQVTSTPTTTLTVAVQGGSVEITDDEGNASLCDATTSPCELEVEGDSITLEATPDTPGDVPFFDPPCPDGPGDSCVFDLILLDDDGDEEVTIGVTFEPPAPTGCLDKADLPFLVAFADEDDWCAGAAAPQQELSLLPGSYYPLAGSDVEITAAYGVHLSSFDVSAFPDLGCNRPNVRCVENGFVAPVGPTTLVVLFRTGTTTAASLDEQTVLGISVDDGSPLLDPYWGAWSAGGGLRLTLSTFQNFVFADGIRADGTSFTTQGMKGGRVVEDGPRLLFVLPHQPINATMTYRVHSYHFLFDTYEGDAWTAPGLAAPYQSIVTR